MDHRYLTRQLENPPCFAAPSPYTPKRAHRPERVLELTIRMFTSWEGGTYALGRALLVRDRAGVNG